MSEERQNQSGERRLERIRAEHGMPVRRAPIAVGALVGGALGAWMAGVPAQLLVTVREGIAASASVAALDGAGSVRSLILQVAAAAWPALSPALHAQLAEFYTRKVAAHIRGPY